MEGVRFDEGLRRVVDGAVFKAFCCVHPRLHAKQRNGK